MHQCIKPLITKVFHLKKYSNWATQNVLHLSMRKILLSQQQPQKIQEKAKATIK